MTADAAWPAHAVEAHFNRMELRAFRQAKGWTHAEAAFWAGVDERTWRRWEYGESRIHPAIVRLVELTRAGS